MNVHSLQVKETFNSLYHTGIHPDGFDDGHPTTKGRKYRETLIPSLKTLKKIYKKLGKQNMAVVTGRPKAEAQEFLKRFEIEHLFQVVVAMEDT